MSVVTVAIPVLNGERYLGEVLAMVRAQELDRELELLVVDSGSTDGSLDIAREHGAVVHSIPRASFSHGATRNWMMELARGDHVAFLTQDATPAHPRWLAALLAGFEAAGDVALVFGPHRPRPDASHMIKAEMWRFFRSWGEDGIDVQRVDLSDEHDLAAYRREAWRRQYFSDVNGCVARRAWQEIPYRPVPYAEDQLLGREMVEAGWAKAFSPEAEVLHSHDYPPGDFMRRYFDEYRSLREVLGHVEPVGPRRSARDVWHLVKADRAYLREVEGLSKPASLGPLAVSVRHHALRTAGAVLGTRADRLPRRAREALSLEGRDSFEPVAIPGSPLADGAAPARRLEPADPGWDYGFVRDAFPRRPLSLEPARDLADKHSLELAWVLPPWKRGSGGHTTIFRIIRMLEEKGHRCSVHVFDPMHRDHRPAHELADEVRDHFIPLDAPIVRGLDGWTGGDVGIATNWWTAYPLRDLPHCAEKAYLVQDVEPEFHARSAEYLWAEETYRMDYRCIAYTPWMAEILRDRHGLWAEYFECGTDLLTYRPGREDTREPATVAVYARLETERRAVELALAALAVVKERRPEVHVVTFGSERRLPAPFEHENLGVVSPASLAALYQRATVGLCFSLTTHSLVAQEMMAGGLPVIELEGENVSSQLGASGEHVVQAAPDPVSVADAVLALLDDPSGRREMAVRARGFVETRTWDRAGRQVDEALRKFLSEPRS
ncbi:MAG: glycosyltransferase [Thermoleophilaceae bacterium]